MKGGNLMSNEIFITDGNGAITGLINTEYSGELIIPDYINEEKITTIKDNAFAGNRSLISVTIPENTRLIDSYA